MGLPGTNIELIIEKLPLFFPIAVPFVTGECNHLVPVSHELFLPGFSSVRSCL